jgi:hypothetical protein
MTSDPLASATPDSLHLALERRFLSATVNGTGSPVVTVYPFAAAETAMSVVTPVFEARDAEAREQQARTARLESVLGEMLAGLKPYPAEGSGYWRQAVPVSDRTLERWRAVLGGWDAG